MGVPREVGGWGGGGYTQTGIRLAMYPSTVRGVPIELQQSTGSTLASSNWTSVFFPPSTRGPLFYTATLPISTKRYYFRARHTGGGYSAGAFTPTVSARPVVIPEWIPPVTVNAAGNVEVPGADILISSGNKPKVGSQNTTSYLRKRQRLGASALNPTSTGTKVDLSQGSGQWIKPSVTATSEILYATLDVPPGVTLRTLSVRFWKKTTSDVVRCILNIGSNDTLLATTGTALNTTGGSTTWRTKSSTAIKLLGSPLTLSTEYTVYAEVHLKGAANSSDARFQFAELVYDMPDYRKAI